MANTVSSTIKTLLASYLLLRFSKEWTFCICIVLSSKLFCFRSNCWAACKAEGLVLWDTALSSLDLSDFYWSFCAKKIDGHYSLLKRWSGVFTANPSTEAPSLLLSYFYSSLRTSKLLPPPIPDEKLLDSLFLHLKSWRSLSLDLPLLGA